MQSCWFRHGTEFSTNASSRIKRSRKLFLIASWGFVLGTNKIKSVLDFRCFSLTMTQNSLLWSFQTTSINTGMFTLESMININIYAPINVKSAGRGGGGGSRAWCRDLTFFKNLQSNFLPTGKSFQSIATKFPHPGLHIAVKYPKAEPKKSTIKISPNKILQSLSILRCCITEDTCSYYCCNNTF